MSEDCIVSTVACKFSCIFCMGSWLNLHTFLPYRDVRRLVYSYLDKYDKEVVEIAHGVRVTVTRQTIAQFIDRGYVGLVKLLYDRYFVSYPKRSFVAKCLAESFNAELVSWFLEKAPDHMCKEGKVIIEEAVLGRHDALVKQMCLEHGLHELTDMYGFLAKTNNLSLAKWFRWKFPTYGIWVENCLRDGDLQFMQWLEDTFNILRCQPIRVRNKVYEKFPELKRKRLKTSNVA